MWGGCSITQDSGLFAAGWKERSLLVDEAKRKLKGCGLNIYLKFILETGRGALSFLGTGLYLQTFCCSYLQNHTKPVPGRSGGDQDLETDS